MDAARPPVSVEVVTGPGAIAGWQDIVHRILDAEPTIGRVAVRREPGGEGRTRGAHPLAGVLRRGLDRSAGTDTAPDERAAPEPADLVVDLSGGAEATGPALRVTFGPERRADPFDGLADVFSRRGSTLAVSVQRADTGAVVRAGRFGVSLLGVRRDFARVVDTVAAWIAQCVALRPTDAVTSIGPVGSLPVDAPADRDPVGVVMVLLAATGALARRAVTAESWTIGTAPRDFDDVLRDGLGDVRWWSYAPPSLGRRLVDRPVSVADPFLVAPGTRALFEYLEHGRPGAIAACDVAHGLPAGPPTVLLRDETHYSYPFPLASPAGGDAFLPENADRDHAARYRLDGDSAVPGGEVLSSLPAIDTTIVTHDGRSYAFCTLRRDGRENEELHLFVDDPSGGFRPHPENPVVLDRCSARPAGALIRHGGRLYRPGQDCGPTYGARVVIHEVLELTPTRYRERAVATLDPPPGFDGVHTIGFVDGTMIVDGKRHFISPFDVAARVRRAVRRVRAA